MIPITRPPRTTTESSTFNYAGDIIRKFAAHYGRAPEELGEAEIREYLLHLLQVEQVSYASGLSPDGTQWRAARKGYFLPVKVLSKLFRGKFLAGLSGAYRDGQLELAGSVVELADPKRFGELRDRLYRQAWVVYAKPPFGGAAQVYRYLGRYTHRVAISNARLVSLEDGQVPFRYKDYADNDSWKMMQLSAEEFLRRFLLHVLPKRFVRIRHYGLLAGRNVPTKLARCRELLGSATTEPELALASQAGGDTTETEPELPRCPHCRHPLARYRFDGPLARTSPWPLYVPPVAVLDSS